MIQADPGKSAQSWKTDGIASMERPGAVARPFMGVVSLVERLNLKLAKLGNSCVYDCAAFPWAADVERQWRVIRDELDRVLARKSELPNVQDLTADAAALSRDLGAARRVELDLPETGVCKSDGAEACCAPGASACC